MKHIVVEVTFGSFGSQPQVTTLGQKGDDFLVEVPCWGNPFSMSRKYMLCFPYSSPPCCLGTTSLFPVQTFSISEYHLVTHVWLCKLDGGGGGGGGGDLPSHTFPPPSSWCCEMKKINPLKMCVTLVSAGQAQSVDLITCSVESHPHVLLESRDLYVLL